VYLACNECRRKTCVDERGGHLLGIEQRFVGGNIEMRIRLMQTAKHPQIRAQSRGCSFTRIAMRLTFSIVTGKKLLRRANGLRY